MTAKDYIARGWTVIPLEGKKSLVQWKDAENCEDWWRQWPDAGVGLVLGERSGVVRVDADGEEAAQKLTEMFGKLPVTMSFRTPSGGYGWLLEWHHLLVTTVLWRGPGEHQELRLMSDGSYTAVPPTPGYRWLTEAPVALAPMRMLDFFALRRRRAS